MSDLFIRFGDNLRVVPTIHHRIAFSQLVSRGLARSWRPDVIALELPGSVKEPIIEGLKNRSSGQLAVGKRLKEFLEATPVSSLTGYQHTRQVLAATAHILRDARRYACTHLGIQPDCSLQEWATQLDLCFEPFVVIVGDPEENPIYHYNVVSPERRFHASEAYASSRRETSPGICSTPLGGRVWYTPPYYAGDHWKRADWVHAGNQAYVPRVRDIPPRADGDDWRLVLLRRALRFCRKHLLYVSPLPVLLDHEFRLETESRGIRVCHVPLGVVDSSSVALVTKDDHEWSPFVHPDMKDAQMEVFSLHDGDAYIAALRFAIHNNSSDTKEKDIEIACIDRELDSYELRRANDRPPMMRASEIVPFIEDTLLSSEGLEAFYSRIQTVVETTRVEEVDGERDLFMAAALRRFIDAGKQVLFICGAAHWGSIRALLEGPVFSDPTSVSDTETGKLLCSGQFSLLGAGDEIPAFVVGYERLRRSRKGATFRHARAACDLEARILKALRRVSDVSPADLMTFSKYLSRLCKETGVVVPRFYHLEEAARSCLGPHGRKMVYQAAMTFFSCPDGVPALSNALFSKNGAEVMLNDETLNILSRHGGIDYVYDREKREVKQKRKRDQKQQQGQDLRYAVGDWETHMKSMLLLARRIVRPKIAAAETLPVTDVLHGTIDPRATIRALIRGEGRFYQRVPKRSALIALNEFEGFDPVLWSFEKKLSRTPEYLVLDNDTPELVVGVAATPRIPREGQSYECNFELLGTWIPRFADADPAMMKRLKRWIAQGNEAYIPTRAAFWRALSNSMWQGESPVEKMLLLACDYCREYVIYVAEDEPTSRVREEFQSRRKRLLYAALSEFDLSDIHELRAPVFDERFDKVN